MTYVDGFVLVIAKKKLAAYKKMAKMGGNIWMKHGAVSYVEAVGDDLNPEWVGVTFPKLTKCTKAEVPVFSFITYRNKKHRDQVNAKVMNDPHMTDPKNVNKVMPFDMKRMSYGGFEAITDL